MKSEIHDDFFGVLRQTPHYEYYYESNLEFIPGKIIPVTLSVEEFAFDADGVSDEALAKAINNAKKLYSNLQTRESAIRRAVAEDQIDNYNENWNQTPEGQIASPISLEDFISQMDLISATLRENGESIVSYTVGELFSDHSLFAHVDIEFGVPYVEFAG